MENPVILSAVRTPIGKFMGGLSPLSATELGREGGGGSGAAGGN